MKKKKRRFGEDWREQKKLADAYVRLLTKEAKEKPYPYELVLGKISRIIFWPVHTLIGAVLIGIDRVKKWKLKISP